MPDPQDEDLGYFDRRKTHNLIADLGVPRSWTIYVGLGATIDRTNVTWNALIERVLLKLQPDAGLNELIVSKNGPVRAATMVEAMYEARFASPKAELRHEIHSALYGYHRFMQGRILPNLAAFAFTLARKGHSVAFVTPNYDDYLDQEISDYFSLARREGKLGGAKKPLLLGTKIERLGEKGWEEPGRVSCVHIHGFIPEVGKASGTPVLGEYSYRGSEQSSRQLLKTVFQARNVLIVGSSVSDTPLVNALIDTRTGESTDKKPPAKSRTKKEDGKKNEGVSRYVLQPLQSSEWRGLKASDRASLLEWNAKRLAALDVKPIHPDFFGQVGQLISELETCVRERDARDMRRPIYWRRYDARLAKWWEAWADTTLKRRPQQKKHYQMLSKRLREIRSVIQAPFDESLKLELWARWMPHRDRRLGLWASSVGTWPDVDSIRMDAIHLESEYRSVQIFCAGAPRILQESDASDARWRAYLGVPIWLDSSSGQLPVGVISLASMRPASPSSKYPTRGIISEQNLENLTLAMDLMVDTGQMLLNPDSLPLS